MTSEQSKDESSLSCVNQIKKILRDATTVLGKMQALQQLCSFQSSLNSTCQLCVRDCVRDGVRVRVVMQVLLEGKSRAFSREHALHFEDQRRTRESFLNRAAFTNDLQSRKDIFLTLSKNPR